MIIMHHVFVARIELDKQKQVNHSNKADLYFDIALITYITIIQLSSCFDFLQSTSIIVLIRNNDFYIIQCQECFI